MSKAKFYTTYRAIRSFSTEGRKIWRICKPSEFSYSPCYAL